MVFRYSLLRVLSAKFHFLMVNIERRWVPIITSKMNPSARKIVAGLTITGYFCVVDDAILKRIAEKPIPAGIATIEDRNS